jgi:hypothetical protein
MDEPQEILVTFAEIGRLDPATAADLITYELRSPGTDGRFDDPRGGRGGDDQVFFLPPQFDGERTVLLALPEFISPLPSGVYRLTIHDVLIDADGNPLGDTDGDGVGADYVEQFFVGGPLGGAEGEGCINDETIDGQIWDEALGFLLDEWPDPLTESPLLPNWRER